MPDDATSSLRYSAFISYSSRDQKFAAWLHRELEAYRLPGHLAHETQATTLRGDRLKPLFHDTWELNAAHDLPGALREAIAQSESLIVVCSPNAAASDWVGREIELFRELHGDSNIRAALLEGDPESAFHPALLTRSDGQAMEPLAADFRRGGSTRKLAALKLIAALAGVQLDELVQRDGQRRTRQVMVASAAAVAAMAVISVLSVLALTAREAERLQRAKGEAVNEVMLTELSPALRRTGRTDVSSIVHQAVLDYYRDQPDLPPDAQMQRARALHGRGTDEETRGDLEQASVSYAQAWRITDDLLAKAPRDLERTFLHAQSEYYVGNIAWQKGDGAVARRRFEAYAGLARELGRRAPKNLDYRMETAYAESNLGTLALRQAGDAAAAEGHFGRALETLKSISAAKPQDADIKADLADGYGWLANAQAAQGKLAAAQANRDAQRPIIDVLLAEDPLNVSARIVLLSNKLATARLAAQRGEYDAALAEMDRGRDEARVMMKSAPDNVGIAIQARAFELFKIHTQLDAPAGRRPSPAALNKALGGCERPSTSTNDRELSRFCQILRARILAAGGDARGTQRALKLVREASDGDVYSRHWGIDFAEETRRASVTGLR